MNVVKTDRKVGIIHKEKKQKPQAIARALRINKFNAELELAHAKHNPELSGYYLNAWTRVLKALSDKTRVRNVMILRGHLLTLTSLSKLLKIDIVSHHVQVLRNTGVIESDHHQPEIWLRSG